MNIVRFKDTVLTAELETEGKVVFPLLNADEIQELKKSFEELHAEFPEGFYATTHAKDKAWRKQVSDEIIKTIQKRAEPLFENIHLLGGAFISKAPGEKGILPLHQDWNIVDEKEARSYNLWIPLVDVNEHNGAMRILERSHRKQETYRGPNLPPVLYPISEEVDQYMISLNMKAGEALLYDHALWHSSPMNQTEVLRLAIVFGTIPQGAQMKFYYQKGSVIEEYNSKPNFFFDYDPEDGPKVLEKNKEFDFENKMLNKEEFEKIYLGRKPPQKKESAIFSFLKRKNK
jgi:hypothetical protein